MNWSPFLEIFVGLFLALGIGLGWFTRIRVIVIGLAAGLFVFATILIAEQAMHHTPWNRELSSETLWVYFMLGVFAAVPAFIAALIGRLIKRRREK
ncbi:hypothetical protein INR77_15080 [Erythrobacter sp. SCSIO 43205]|uniref:hypothetical protein n=1 Tax=Erythrobacter sp. SCSIO 43205 TaxID=2779361 RepID=UPI001CAA1597|nr:hypothetical protein [Erythrobacter sp. SCSIO 43205]UAB78060.1 hypothetical protein INR77_15080 [Erythrobacter sp. SCSIO 43205]